MKSINKYKRLAVNTTVFAIGNFGSKILVFLLTRLYTKYISEDGMGVKELLETTALLLLPVFSFSLTEAVIRFGLEKSYDKRKIFSTAGILTFLGLALMAVCVPILRFIPFLNFINGYTVLLVIYICTSAIRSLCSQFVRVRNMVKLYSLDGILATLMLFIFNIFFIKTLGLGVKGFMISVILSDFCSSAFLFITARLDKFFNIRYYSKKLATTMMKFSLPMIPAIVMWTITGLSDKIFIEYMHSDRVVLGEGTVGIYGVANKIPNLISMVSTIFFQAWNMSAITENNSRDRSDFYEKIYSAYEAFLFIASAGLILLVKPVSAVLIDTTNYSDYGQVWKYTPILIIAVLFTSLDQFLGSIYTATKHTKNSFTTSLCACVLNIFLNICLIPAWGIYGASIATFLSYYLCFWIRIIDARYYVPFKFDGVKSVVNTVLLFVMSYLTITSCSLLWVCTVAVLIFLNNYKALLLTLQKILGRKSSSK